MVNCPKCKKYLGTLIDEEIEFYIREKEIELTEDQTDEVIRRLTEEFDWMIDEKIEEIVQDARDEYPEDDDDE